MKDVLGGNIAVSYLGCGEEEQRRIKECWKTNAEVNETKQLVYRYCHIANVTNVHGEASYANCIYADKRASK